MWSYNVEYCVSKYFTILDNTKIVKNSKINFLNFSKSKTISGRPDSYIRSIFGNNIQLTAAEGT